MRRRPRISKRGAGWSAVVDVAPPGSLTRQQRRVSGRTKAEVSAKVDQLLAEVRDGSYVAPSDLTLGDYLTQWLDTLPVRRKKTTCESYAGHMRRHVVGRPIARVRLQQLTPLHLDGLYADLLAEGRIGPRTVQFVHGVIHSALADALRKHLVMVNVASAASPPSGEAVRAPEGRTWSAEEIATFLTHVNRTEDRWRAMWRLVVMTGMRRGELAGLRWRDLDLDAARLSVNQTVVPVRGGPAFSSTKSHRSRRSIDLDKLTVAELRAHRARQAEERLAIGPGYRDTDLVFCRPDGAVLNPGRISEWFSRRAEAAGLPHIRLHDLRHSHASHLLAKGRSPKVVSERLGHAQESFTLSRYGHVMPGMGKDAAQGFADDIDRAVGAQGDDA